MTATKNIEVLPAFQLETLPEKKKEYPFYLHLVKWAFATFGHIFPKQAAKAAYYLFSKPRVRAVHRTTDPVLESARLFEVLYGKIILKCYEWGTGEKTILLVHGWESRGTAMRTFVPGLVAAGYRVVALDGPAHGNSSGKHTNLPHFAGAIKAVIYQTGGVESIITHSFGGATSVFALSHLDNSIHIEKLVLIGVPASTRQVVEDYVKLINLPAAASKSFQKLLQSKSGLPLKELDVEQSLGKVNVGEVLIVHDKFDLSVPFTSAESIFEKYEHTSLLVTQGYGHYKLMKHRDVIDRVVEFVAG
ncbi:MAG: alpha/beta hydrolase [Lewinellaceae bacterium]|nr:alpha/beta hydrolase [Saprospiraceae bacterium]MCB9340611.1 alpha/beta hydrolase [Lewinellaceae bacterium]